MKKIHVVAALILKDDKVLIAQRKGGDFNGGWEFPGGKIEPNETGQEALVREIKEELNLDIIVQDLLTTVNYDYPHFHLEMDCFLCEVLTTDLSLNDHLAIEWISVTSETDSINWVPADIEVFNELKSRLAT